jgi:hypothetical protein
VARYLEGMVLVAGGLPMGVLDLWCHIRTEIVGGFHRLVVGVLRVRDLDVWWRWGRQIRVLASIPTGEGSRWCTEAL